MNDTNMRQFMEADLSKDGFDVATSTLKFSSRNSKLGDITTFSLPAGHSCPFAKDCRSCATLKATRSKHTAVKKGKSNGFGIQDGPHTQFRCYTAIDEVMRPAVRKARWHNFLLLLATTVKGVKATADLIEQTLPEEKWSKPTRIHVSGDFFNLNYFDAWIEVARRNPGRVFYAYTKALPFWVKRKATLPENLRLTASFGGTHDHLISKHNLKFAKVVESLEEAVKLDLAIDHDDSHAYGDNKKSFALLVHGQQPAGSKWAKAWMALKKVGMGGYGKDKKNTVAGAKAVSAGGLS